MVTRLSRVGGARCAGAAGRGQCTASVTDAPGAASVRSGSEVICVTSVRRDTCWSASSVCVSNSTFITAALCTVQGHKSDNVNNKTISCPAACDDGCTGVLLDDLDALDGSIASLNLSGVILAPYSQLMTLENQTREVKVSHGPGLRVSCIGHE